MKSSRRSADVLSVETCGTCGAALLPDAGWCGQCYSLRPSTLRAAAVAAAVPLATVPAAPVAAADPDPRFAGGAPPPSRPVAAPPTAPAPVKTRWRKTDTTFGPLGRVLATLALVVPFVLFVAVGILTGGFTIAGAVIWGGVIMPWGLRDTWRAGQLTAR